MSKTVPEEWAIRTLSDLASIDNKSLKNNTDPDYRFRYIDIASVKTAKVDIPTEYVSFGESPSRARKCVRKGDVLMSTVRPNLKGFAYFDVQGDDFVVSTGFAVLTANKMSDSNFLYQSILSDNVTRQIESLVAGSNYPAISSANVKSLEVLAPPLPEQQKIATILSSVDNVIEKTRAQIDKLKDLKTGMMQELLTKGIGHTEFKDSLVGLIPTTWKVLPLSDISTFRRGSFPQPYGKPEWYADNGFPFVQVYDIDNNGQLKKITKVTISEQAASKSVFAEKGSIIVSLQGSIGRVAITQYDAYIDRTILIFSNLSSELDKDYFAMLIEDIFQEKKEEADGGVIKTITKATLKNFSLKMPPKTEQEKISKAVRAIESKTLIVTEHLEKLILTKKALMQDLLTGKVRVNLTDKESAVV